MKDLIQITNKYINQNKLQNGSNIVLDKNLKILMNMKKRKIKYISIYKFQEKLYLLYFNNNNK